jgi:hypothetical protein
MYTTIGAFCRGQGGHVAKAILGMFLMVLWDKLGFYVPGANFDNNQTFIFVKII